MKKLSKDMARLVVAQPVKQRIIELARTYKLPKPKVIEIAISVLNENLHALKEPKRLIRIK
jgi:hypothetical protein